MPDTFDTLRENLCAVYTTFMGLSSTYHTMRARGVPAKLLHKTLHDCQSAGEQLDSAINALLDYLHSLPPSKASDAVIVQAYHFRSILNRERDLLVFAEAPPVLCA